MRISRGQGAGSTPPQIEDHFAPKYLVGNVVSGDPAVPQAAPFIYIPDPGDGSGIAMALALAAVEPGDIWIRPGTYDLGAGAVVTPMVIPPGTCIVGAGHAGNDIPGSGTRIVAKPTGDQGIFVLQPFCTLMNMAFASLASDAGSVGSTALVSNAGSCNGIILEHLDWLVTTAAGGALREGLRLAGITNFEPVAAYDLTFQVPTFTGVGSPSIGMALDGSFVFGRDIVVLGSDIALNSTNGAVFACVQFIALGFQLYGVYALTGGSVRIVDAGIIATGPVLGGVVMGNADNRLRDIFISGGGPGSIGIWEYSPGTTVAGPAIRDCIIGGDWEIGIKLGDTATDSAVSGGGVQANNINGALRWGILVETGATQNADHTELIHNIIAMGYDGVNAPIGVELQGQRHSGTGNDVTNESAPAASGAIGVLLTAQRCTWSGNITVFTGLFGIHSVGDANALANNNIFCNATVAGGACVQIDGDRSTIAGGRSSQLQNPYVGPAVVVTSDFCAVTGLVTNVFPGVFGLCHGIGVSGNNNAITGNLCEGSSGRAVVDTGFLNSLSNNLEEPGTVPFTPIDLGSDLTLWLDPNGIHQTAGVFTSWDDFSPAGNDVTTPAGAPPIVTLLSNPAVSFNGTTQLANGGATGLIITDATQFHAFAVVQQDGPGGLQAAAVSFLNGAFFGDSTGRWGAMVLTNAAPANALQGSVYNGAQSYAGQKAFVSGTPVVIEFWLDPATNLLHARTGGVDGTTDLLVGTINTAAFGVFRLGGAAVQMASRISRIIVSKRVLTVPERAQMRAYLTSVTGLPA